jgi:hypothetical protein
MVCIGDGLQCATRHRPMDKDACGIGVKDIGFGAGQVLR